MTVHVTVFSAATDEWAGRVDARTLLTIEFSFKLPPINFLPSLSLFLHLSFSRSLPHELGEDLKWASEHVTRFRDFCDIDLAPSSGVG